MRLNAGTSYQTPSGRDAIRLHTGTANIFIVPEKAGIFQRPLHLMTANAGTTIPELVYVDENYVTWRLQLEAVDDCELKIIENGCTRPLKRKFIDRAQIPSVDAFSFEQTLIEHYMSAVITEDVFILKSEQAREEDRKQSLEIIRHAAEEPAPEPSEMKEEEVHRITGPVKRASRMAKCWQILAGTDRKRLAVMALLTAALGSSGIGLTWVAGQVFDGHKSIVFALLLTVYLLLSALLMKTASDSADNSARELQKDQIEACFAGREREGVGTDPRSEAVKILLLFDRVRKERKAAYEATLRFLVAAICWGCLLIFLPGAAALCAAMSVAGFAVLYSSKHTAEGDRKNAETIRMDAEADLRQFLGNMGKIRLSGAGEHALRRYYTRIAESKTAERSFWKKELLGQALARSFIAAAVIIAILITISVMIWDAGQAAMATVCSVLICLQMFTVADRIAQIDPLSYEGIKEKEEAADQENMDGLPAESCQNPDEAPLLELSHAEFAYDNRQVLQDVSLTVSEGEYLGIAGASGSGKTTLMRILTGMHSPQRGRLYYRGRAAEGEAMNLFRRHAGIVLQDDQLLRGSIRENILAGRKDVDRKTLRDAAECSLLAEEIDRMPMGYETLIDEQTETVSSGQRQKILLARALVRRPEILFLDEAESDLDEKTQRQIRENIRAQVPTGVVISHHFRSLEKCDRIIVLDQGRIAEEGTVEDLIRKKGIFFKLMRRQL